MVGSTRARAAVLSASLLLAGCTALGWRPRVGGGDKPARWDEATFARKPLASYRVRSGDDAPPDSIVGTVRRYRIRPGDTLLDVARWHDLGYNEIVDANPGVDPIIPPVGKEIVLPTAWVLPCCTRDGIVINIPEMRLYYFRRDGDDPRGRIVVTHPVGLGRDDRRTPRGTFRVRAKTVNPRWDIPESIRREHIRERGDARRSIAGGAPDNPLGKYRLQLTRRLYGIHGTDTPWGVGMQVTHGCVRLYPEDIEKLFPLVPIGTPVEFTYQPVKVGRRDGAVYVEVHRDIYRYTTSLSAATKTALARQHAGDLVARPLLDAALASSAGVPVRVSTEATVATGRRGRVTN